MDFSQFSQLSQFSQVPPQVWIAILGTVAAMALIVLIALRRRRADDDTTLRLHRVERGVARDHLPDPPWYTGPPSFSPKARLGTAPPPHGGMIYQPPLPPPLHEAKAVTPPHGLRREDLARGGTPAVAEAVAGSIPSAVSPESGAARGDGPTEPTVVMVSDDLQRPMPKNLTFSPDTQPVNKVDYANYRYEALFPPPDPDDEPVDDLLGDDVMRTDRPHYPTGNGQNGA